MQCRRLVKTLLLPRLNLFFFLDTFMSLFCCLEAQRAASSRHELWNNALVKFPSTVSQQAPIHIQMKGNAYICICPRGGNGSILLELGLPGSFMPVLTSGSAQNRMCPCLCCTDSSVAVNYPSIYSQYVTTLRYITTLAGIFFKDHNCIFAYLNRQLQITCNIL